MIYCRKCGKELDDEAKFCSNCGLEINKSSREQKIVYEGKIHKCPNCGEKLKSFEFKCPACGYELREVEVNNAVKELAQKLEKDETKEK